MSVKENVKTTPHKKISLSADTHKTNIIRHKIYFKINKVYEKTYVIKLLDIKYYIQWILAFIKR